MNCPRCGADSRVVNTRPEGQFAIKRQRKCVAKGHVFHSTELLNAGVSKNKQRAANAAAAKRVRLWHRDIDIAKRLHHGADLLVKAYKISWSAVYQAAQRGRKYARKSN